MIKYRKYLLKLKDAFLEENVQNTKMLDLLAFLILLKKLKKIISI